MYEEETQASVAMPIKRVIVPRKDRRNRGPLNVGFFQLAKGHDFLVG